MRIALTLPCLAATVTLGSAQATRLNLPLPPAGNVVGYLALETTGRVAYVADGSLDQVFELHSAPLDGSAPAVRLHPAFPAGRSLRAFPAAGENLLAASPDGTRVAYVADAVTDDVHELFVVAGDGSGTLVRVSGALPAFADVRLAFAFSPDGATLVYVADALVDEVFELFSVPADGSAAPTRVSAPLAVGEDVESFRIAPDGTRIAYAASALHSVAPDGSAHATLGLGADALVYAFTSDSARLVFEREFVTGPPTVELSALYSIPAAGGSATQLSPRPIGSSTILDWSLAADSRVVYLAFDGNFYEFVESVAAAGGPVVVLSPLFFDVTSFRLARDGEHVVFFGGDFPAPATTLYSAPCDGSQPALLLAGPTLEGAVNEYTAGGPHAAFLVSSAGVENLYLRDVEALFPAELLHSGVDKLRPSLDPARRRIQYEQILGSGYLLRSLPLDACRPADVLSALPNVSQRSLLAGSPRTLFLAHAAGTPTDLWIANHAPEALQATPASGPVAGGNTLTLTGRGFSADTRVFLDGQEASVTFVSATQLSVQAPPGRLIGATSSGRGSPGPGHVRGAPALSPPLFTPRTVDLVVEDCGSSATLRRAYTYLP